MKTLYLECSMGAAGDMLCASLLELFPQKEHILAELNQLGLPQIELRASTCNKYGISGTHFSVLANNREEHVGDCDLTAPICSTPHHTHAHTHNSMSEIEQIINNIPALPQKVKNDAVAVYKLIAEAESHVHNMPVYDIHFHEVGTLDAIADIVCFSYLLYRLNPEQIFASPVHVGSGHVHCAHGILPVPAPATAYLLKGVPIYGGSIRSELCTPTGAALLRYFVRDFREIPLMTVNQIGYGMGTKDVGVLSCVRAFLGESGI